MSSLLRGRGGSLWGIRVGGSRMRSPDPNARREGAGATVQKIGTERIVRRSVRIGLGASSADRRRAQVTRTRPMNLR